MYLTAYALVDNARQVWTQRCRFVCVTYTTCVPSVHVFVRVIYILRPPVGLDGDGDGNGRVGGIGQLVRL